MGPLPKTVIGAVPKGPVVAAGNATAGKAVFNANGCGGCHAFKPAAATGAVGPALDSMAADASRAGVSLDSFIKASITDPGAFIAKGYADGIMPATFGQSLKPQELADLIAFLQQ